MSFSIKTFVGKLGKKIVSESPAILAGMAVAGVVTTVILSHRAGIKADAVVKAAKEAKEKEIRDNIPEALATNYDAAKIDKFVEDNSKVTILDRVKITWKHYLPVVISAGLTITCIIVSHRISSRRLAAVTTLLSAAEAGLQQYQNKIEEMFGKGKAEKIKDTINQDAAKNSFPDDENGVLITGKGDVMFMDKMTGRFFKSTVDAVRKAQNEINLGLMDGDYASLNDWYYALGLGGCDLGDLMGFAADFPLKIHMTAASVNDHPVMVIDYSARPTWYEDRSGIRAFP